MTNLGTNLFDEVVELLLPYMRTVSQRETELHPVVLGKPVGLKIEWEGDPREFTVQLVRLLSSEELLLVLSRLKVGEEQRIQLDAISERISKISTAPARPIGQRRRFDLRELLEELPEVGMDFVGRAEEFKWLDATYASEKTSIAVLHAFGGVGKSALVRRWLELNFCNSEDIRFAGTSFFSQGTTASGANSTQFIAKTLFELGVPTLNAEDQSVQEMPRGSPWSRGQLLADKLADQPTILVLDGLEPLQYGPTSTAEPGQIRDEGIAGLLSKLLSPSHSKVFCVITTRLPISGGISVSDRCAQRQLELLSTDDATTLLTLRGITATPAKLADAATYLGNHPLALVLAAEYIRTFKNGDLDDLWTIEMVSTSISEGRHAKSIMAAYEVAVKRDGDTCALEILYIVGLFDRVIQRIWIKSIVAQPCIPGLTDVLVKTEPDVIQSAISKLVQWGLLLGGRPDSTTVDAHPLVREYFGATLLYQRPDAYKSGHARIYYTLKDNSSLKPNNVDELAPLLMCMIHGCKAGLYEEAFDTVYMPRIFQGPQHVAMQQLGAVRSLIGIFGYFFRDRDWTQPIPKSEGGLPVQKLLDVFIHAGMCFLQAEGYASASAQICYEQAYQILLTSADDNAFSVLWGLWVTSLVRAELVSSNLQAERLLDFATKRGDAESLTEAHRVMGATHYFRGRFAATQALNELETGLSLYVPRDKRKSRILYLTDPKVNNLTYCACTLWFMGYPDQAVRRGEEAIEFARTQDLPFSLIVAQIYTAWIYQYCGDTSNTRRVAEAALSHAQSQGFQHWENGARIILGWVCLEEGDATAAVEQIESGIAGWRRNGAELILTYYYALLAEAYAAAQRREASREVIEKALQLAAKNGEKFFEAELWRLKALHQGSRQGQPILDCIARAVDVADAQGACSLKLRSLTTGLELAASSKEREILVSRTKAVLNEITEGHTTRDLIRARRAVDGFQA